MKLSVVLLAASVLGCTSQPRPAPIETSTPTTRESVEYQNGGYAIVGDESLAESSS